MSVGTSLLNLAAKLTLDSSDFDKGLDSAQSKAQTFGQKLKSGLSTSIKLLGAGLAATGTAMVGFGVSSVRTGQQFDRAMSQVAATMGVTSDEVQELRDFAKEMGATTVFTANQSAQALNYMALAGYDAEMSMRMLPNVLNLAAAGGMDLARASDMVTDAQSALGLTASETSVMVDQMARAASRSNTSVEQLGDAMLTIGGTATLMSGGTDRLSTVLGILADNGIKGSEAGTHLRNMLLKLSSPTDDGAKAMEALGLNVFDAEGKMRDMQDIITDMNVAFAGLTDQEKIQYISAMFNTRDIAAVNALLNTTTERWDELGAEIVNSTGAASKMAGTQLDNLSGAITLMNSAWEGLQITVGEKLMPTLKQFAKFGATSLSVINDAFKEGGLDGAMGAVGDVLTWGLKMITSRLPEMVSAGVALLQSLMNGIIQNLPQLVSVAGQIVQTLATALPTLLPMLMEGIGALWTNIFTTLATMIPDIVPIIVELITNIGQVMLENAQLIIDALVQLINAIMENLPILVEALLPIIVQLIISVGNMVIDNAPTIIAAVLELFGMLLEQSLKAVGEILTALFNVLRDMWNTWVLPALKKVGEFFVNVFDAITGVFKDLGAWFNENVIQPIVNFFEGLRDSVSGFFSNLWEDIKGIWNSVSTWFDENVVQPVSGFFSGMWDGLKQGASDAWEGVKGAFSAVTTWFRDTFSEAWQKVKDVFSTGGKIFSGIKEGIENTFKTVVNAIIRGINTVIAVPFNAINDFLWVLRNVSILGLRPFDWISLFNVPQIPELAQGGVLKRGQVGVLEGNGAEAVVPLEKNREWIHAVAQDFGREMSGGTTVTINVYGAQGQDINELAEVISRKINDAVSRDRRVFA